MKVHGHLLFFYKTTERFHARGNEIIAVNGYTSFVYYHGVEKNARNERENIVLYRQGSGAIEPTQFVQITCFWRH